MSHTIGFEAEIHAPDVDEFVPLLRSRQLWGPGLPDDHGANDWTGCGWDDCEECADGYPEDCTYRDYDYDEGYAGLDRAHYNHCECDACIWGASTLRPHYDCSCAGELVSDPMPWPSEHSVATLVQLEDIMARVGACAGDSAGFHVHVAYPDGVPNPKVAHYFAYYEHQLAIYARQSEPVVRFYNHWLSEVHERVPIASTAGPRDLPVKPYLKPNASPTKGMNLARRSQTWEFRIWNSVTEAWRMHLAIDMSCAFVDACADAPDLPDRADDLARPPLLSFVGPYLSPTGLGYALRHLATTPEVPSAR